MSPGVKVVLGDILAILGTTVVVALGVLLLTLLGYLVYLTIKGPER